MGGLAWVSRLAAPALLAALAAAACRGAPALFTPTDDTPPLGPAPYRLTFEPERDVTPTWSVAGDTIFYVVEEIMIDPFPPMFDTLRVTGILYAIPMDGGTAVQVFPTLQTRGGASTSFKFAAQAPNGTVAAYQLGALYGQLCEGAVAFCSSPVDSTPRLRAASVRLREPRSDVPPESDVSLAIAYEGREFDTSEHPLGLDGLYRVREHPFQQVFSRSGRVSSRLSWSPGGERLVLSDGLRLLTWSPATGSVVTIPGSDDALNPAWSPAGDWIAFERLVRGTMTQTVCEHRVLGRATCFEQRTTWTLPSRSLAIIRPDGSTLRLLPDGRNPAWSADGQRIYYESGGAIWSVGIGGRGAGLVPGTENGFEPALSPDGQHLAFSRVDPESGTADIWVVDTP